MPGSRFGSRISCWSLTRGNITRTSGKTEAEGCVYNRHRTERASLNKQGGNNVRLTQCFLDHLVTVGWTLPKNCSFTEFYTKRSTGEMSTVWTSTLQTSHRMCASAAVCDVTLSAQFVWRSRMKYNKKLKESKRAVRTKLHILSSYSILTQSTAFLAALGWWAFTMIVHCFIPKSQ